ncbi:MAG: proline--tRNA ligase [Planctomycetota bacterium]|jgi:prolyl-tRNA synthetase
MAEEKKGITKREDDFSRWYLDVIQGAELADYSPVRGCMVIRPHGFGIWEKLQASLDKMIKDTGHLNAYFPLFIPESFLKREADHVEGFAPQCAVVTEGGGKPLEEKLYVRPTSETIMYDMYAKWISSWRDLPLLINQWANVVRWEMRTRLFLRTMEFLWQEGHTAHATHKESREETLRMLDVYRTLAEDVLAVPTIKGVKSAAERFAGALETYCIESMMQDGKALQMGTSHDLGQNFAKVFDVQFQDKNGQLKHVWQTSWGVSTRLVGAVIMAHSDDTGLVLPPKVAPIQVVIVPIFKSLAEREAVSGAATDMEEKLKGRFAVKLDDREEHKPGFKFFEWERKGVPLRLEVGPRDLKNDMWTFVRRDTGEKRQVASEEAVDEVGKTLEAIQTGLFKRALEFREKNSFEVDDFSDFKSRNDERDGGFYHAHWCGSGDCEEKVQEETRATLRVIPFERKKEEGACIVCGKPSKGRVVFAKGY